MDRSAVFEQVVAIVKPFVRNQVALANVGEGTLILRDLKVNSARLVDVVLRLQERFAIEVSDDDVDRVRTVGDTVSLVLRLRGEE